MKKIIILGASGQGKVAADIALACGYDSIAFLDDDANKKECMGYSVIGTHDYLRNCDQSIDVFVAIGNSKIRENIFAMLGERGTIPVTLIHPTAVIGSNVRIGAGSIVMPHATIAAETVIGMGAIINTNASVDHENVLGDYVHISVGSHLAGQVQIGSHTWIGIGAIVSNNLSICDNCMIGAGAVVVRDITEPGTYVGVPATLMNHEG
ncbi:MAG: acetyltransferase [Lachnospiraceae bacterium]|nr:acetyltransferase [Lachnospiraceae bacterium]